MVPLGPPGSEVCSGEQPGGSWLEMGTDRHLPPGVVTAAPERPGRGWQLPRPREEFPSFLHPGQRWGFHACSGGARVCKPQERAASRRASPSARREDCDSQQTPCIILLRSTASPILVPVLTPLQAHAGTCNAGDPLLIFSPHPAAASLPSYGNAGRGKRVWNTRPNSSRSVGCRPAVGV